MANSPSDLPTATSDLPSEMTIEILSRLPVKSLLRFKSVCKTWYDLIETPDFISKHLQTQSTLNPPSVLVTSYHRETQKHTASLFFNVGFINGAVNLDFPLLDRIDSKNSGRRRFPVSVGTCNGLVCISLSHYGFPLILWNPCTRQFREIPNSEWQWLDDPYPDDNGDKMVDGVSFGFGYHSSANDYKLIRIVVYSRPERFFVRADLYTMSTETWREIDVDKLSVFFQNDFGGVGTVVLIRGAAPAMLNGVFYWRGCIISTYASEQIEGQEIVMSFDMADEVFRKIRMPVCGDYTWDQSILWQIIELKDKLAVFIYPDDKCCDVWMLNEDQSSWTNQFKIGSFPWTGHYMGAYEKCEISIVGCAKNGELVVVDHKASGDFKLFSYDLKTRDTADLYFGWFPYRCGIYLYTGTLLPVMETNEVVLNKNHTKKEAWNLWN
ncbi:F-box/kelch-repeat protein At3g23880-like [Rhododendron vialii]|uniref:F-box/kelch-repeat protein At3g23880-like n=1 Tax=Rhododendron vialii TaxID=182163 RepID=UPI00265DBF74|nr:F-box/kelch-repeat protein At3g23880-like [Rhododendron vialii]XP_058214497.1 F-box/kelch-repeat protein At3g23880-like [Rhododendron vialii]XP_058214498.1 F-box/kelch-repeat protein At3g23880-like [Rhododendron vialii]